MRNTFFVSNSVSEKEQRQPTASWNKQQYLRSMMTGILGLLSV